MKKIYKYICMAVIGASILPITVQNVCFAEENTMNITIDGLKANTAFNRLYRGAGMVSANNSSRLMLDYKTEHPKKYWKIMNYLFGSNGIQINHLKLEMGSDINSSSGTEPSVKRTEKEPVDITRGAGFQIAADAKKINKELTLDMLWWSEPNWITNAKDIYAARYEWYKEILDAAYNKYNIKFDYVSTTQNEREADDSWTKYLSQKLKTEKECPYDYSRIKIVAGEEVCTWDIADRMLKDKDLLNAVDVIGSHYTSWSTDNAKLLAEKYGKELWLSEGSSPMSYAQGTYRYDSSHSGMSDINGVLDIATRIITMIAKGHMTCYEYQPAVSAYYDGVTYCQKQLITADEPWNGSYLLDGGFFMSLHFSQFLKKGWAIIPSASFADGKPGGDGHAIINSKFCYMTAENPKTGDYSTVITNTTNQSLKYTFKISNLTKAAAPVSIWETRGPETGKYNKNYFHKIQTIVPSEKQGINTFCIIVKPYSLITVSTLSIKRKKYPEFTKKQRSVLALPYTDNYEYKKYSSNYLSSRGNAPRYTTDEGGAFEVRKVNNNNVLMQIITPEIKSKEWGWTPDPVTNFGDDRWFNYSVSADILFNKSCTPDKNYTGIGLRYNLGCNAISGYWLQIFENGIWNLKRINETVASGKLENFKSTIWTRLKIAAKGNKITAWINGTKIGEYINNNKAVLSAGRAAFYSSYNNNCFDNLKVEPIKKISTSIMRFDNTDACVKYSGVWNHETMSSFKNYKRTISKGNKGSIVTINFHGTGIALTGENKNKSILSITIDGKSINKKFQTIPTDSREISFSYYGLRNKNHTLKIRILKDFYSLDGIEITNK